MLVTVLTCALSSKTFKIPDLINVATSSLGNNSIIHLQNEQYTCVYLIRVHNKEIV